MTEGPDVQHDNKSRCGTRAGYKAHRRRGEAACSDCAAASREYVNAYRKAKPAVTAGQDLRKNLRRRALTVMTARHPELYNDYRVHFMSPDSSPSLIRERARSAMAREWPELYQDALAAVSAAPIPKENDR